MAIKEYVGRGLVDTLNDLNGLAPDVGQQMFVQDSGTLYSYMSSGVWVQQGLKQLFNQTGTFSSVTGVTTENSVIGTTGIGSRTLPANFFTVGRTIRYYAGGTYQTPATPGNVTVKIKLGSTILASANLAGTVLSANSTTNRVFADVTVRCDTTGTNGKLYIDGYMGFGIQVAIGAATVPLYAVADMDNAGVAITFDTTSSALFDNTSTWSSASASQGTIATICNIVQIT